MEFNHPYFSQPLWFRKKGIFGKPVSFLVKLTLDVVELDELELIRNYLVAFQHIDQAFTPRSHFPFHKLNSNLAVPIHSQLLNIVAVSVSHQQAHTHHFGLVACQCAQGFCPCQESALAVAY